MPGPQQQVVRVREEDRGAELPRAGASVCVRTVPRVPTGMNTGVSITPWSVVSRPGRAREPVAVLRSSNGINGTSRLYSARAAMKYVLLLALVACQAKSQPPAAGSAAPPAATPAPVTTRTAEVCTGSLAALNHSSCGSGDAGLRAARTSLEGIINTMTKVGDANPKTYDIVCARMLTALEHDLGSAGCTLAVNPALRERVQRLLDEYYNSHTRHEDPGDAAATT